MRKHGMSKTHLYRCWDNMRGRCDRPSSTSYQQYGGRGIKICAEWYDFCAFRDWAFANGYREDLSLERKDVNGDYCPENCTWIPFPEQLRNQQDTVWVEWQGKRVTLRALCEEYGINFYAVYNRFVKLGWRLEEALTSPVRVHKPYKPYAKRKSRPLVCKTRKAARENVLASL